MRRKHVGFVHIFTSAFAALATMLILWRQFDPRVSMFFALYLSFAEMFVQVRWRMGIVCKVCGFDPALYLKDAAKAVEKVKSRLDERRRDPKTLLARPLNLPALPESRALELKELEEKRQNKAGALLSKSV